MNEETLFAEAIKIESPEERSQFLAANCGDNLDLRKDVEDLLYLAADAGSFLEHSPLKAGALTEIDATILLGDDSTYNSASEEKLLGHSVRENVQELVEKIPLDYLQASAEPGSLGRLGHYEVLEVLGRGAFGTVLRAFDEKLQRVVAIKVLAPEMAAMSPARKRFLREARSAAAVRHENIVAIHAVEDDPIPYLVMEYTPGKTLQQQLEEQGPMNLQNALRVGKQIADGLTAAHAQGLIHRDVKPANILLEEGTNMRVRITDFGLARTTDDASVTQSRVIAGTPMYMAPEQVHGHKLDQRADLFSLGSVLYQVLTGQPPFRAPTTLAVLKRVTEEIPRPIQEFVPEVPDWMCELIGHLHAKEPDQRYSSAKEVSDLLAQCALDVQAGRVPKIPDPWQGAQESLAPASQAAQRRRSQSRFPSTPIKIAAAVVVMIGLLGIVASIVVRWTTGSGTLVIETGDPDIRIAVDGEEVTVTDGNAIELTLRPGKYLVVALKDGQPAKQELVSITRNGRTVLRMTLEPATPYVVAPSITQTPIPTPSISIKNPWPDDAPPPAIAPFDAEQAARHQQAWADYLGVPVEFENGIGMKFRLIPPGEFTMGSTPEQVSGYMPMVPEWARDWVKSESPARKVQIAQPFYMAATEVTVGQFQEFVAATDFKTEAETNGLGGTAWTGERLETRPEFTWRHKDLTQSDLHPVGQLCARDAIAFCRWLQELDGRAYQLPDEELWEYACRAGTVAEWSCGTDRAELDRHGLVGWDLAFSGNPVAQKPANPFGLFDVHGNFDELCRSKDGSYVCRGGSTGGDIWLTRSASRNPVKFQEPRSMHGFRVAIVDGALHSSAEGGSGDQAESADSEN